MAIKHVRDYYERMTSDYMEMKKVLEEMENLPESKASQALANIDNIREKVRTLETNYKRLSYVIFLLNQPTRAEKRERYEKQEHKKLEAIPENDRASGVIAENQKVLETLRSFT